MSNLKLKSLPVITLAILFSLFPLISPIYAGQPACNPPPVQTYPSPRQEQNSGGNRIADEQKQFAAAQMRFEKGQQPPSNGAGGADSETHSTLSFYLSILITFGGLYALIVLLYGKFTDQKRRNRRPLRQAFDYALKPSTALAACAFLFVATIIGGTMTSPTVTSAQRNRKNDRQQTTAAADAPNDANALYSLAATSKPVFSQVEVIGGDDITQIGAPYFDNQGNRYVHGGFTQHLSIGNSALTATRDFDGFFAKYDPSGNVLWARQVSGATTNAVPDKLAVEGVTALAVDEAGNVYIGGSFVKTLTLQGGTSSSITLTDGGAAGINYESFLAKYDADGNLLWAKGGNSGGEKGTNNLQTGQNGISKIVFDSFENVYVAGFFSGSKFLEKPVGDYVFGYTNRGKSDIVLAKVNNVDGTPIWLSLNGGTGDDNGVDLVLYSTGFNTSGLVLVGSFDSPSISFATTSGTANYTNTNGSLSTFIAGFNQDGANAYVNFLGNADTVGVSQIAVFNPAPNSVFVFATGYYKNQLSVPLGGLGQSVTLTNTRTGTGEAALAGYVAQVDASDGTFVRAANLGGPGKALAISPFGEVLVMGTVWNSGNFTQSEKLDSLGGDDIYVASFNRDTLEFKWAKTIAGSRNEGLVVIDDTANADNLTKNVYNPLGVAYNPNIAKMVISGDFEGILSLDCLKVSSPGISIRSYIAVIGGNAPNCRLWTGRFGNSNDWDDAGNWNDGIVPSANDSVYINVPSDVRSPTLTAMANVPLTDLTVVNRTLTLQDNLFVGNRFDLLAGIVNAGTNTVSLGTDTQSRSTDGGRVIGKVEKQFAAGAGSFTFPVGTANGASPVKLSNIVGAGTFAVTARQGAYPNQATNLPMNRAARWWNLTNGGLSQVDLTFKYLPGDITSGTESGYRAYRIPTGGGSPALVNSTIDTTTKTVTVPNVAEFSDWTLAQFAAPTAASVSVSGRITAPNGRSVAQAIVTMTDSSGASRTAISNTFGYYHFADVGVGQTYIVSVRHKSYSFAPQIVSVTEEMNELSFSAQ